MLRKKGVGSSPGTELGAFSVHSEQLDHVLPLAAMVYSSTKKILRGRILGLCQGPIVQEEYKDVGESVFRG